eukprot:TRINITY_DN1423_c0_g1_i10.p1 TRINITY_DN1423_c0_g1~~TRINITY_DN1423_c0_g1_i10.p1  ORF type:complete len:221 (+),score=48.41 TRINITY_DN1423_c0_g1_i10:72-734(+)
MEAYLSKIDGSDKNLKLAQYVMKVMVDRVLGKEHEFEKRRALVHKEIGHARGYISALKWVYQMVAVAKESEKWGKVMTSRDVLRLVVIVLTFTEQLTADMQLAQEIWFHAFPREWVDYVFPFAKSSANFFALLDDVNQLQSKLHYLSLPDPDPTKAAAFRTDIFRHRLSIIREICDIALYAHWIDNWKRAITPQQLNILGLISSVLGVFEVYSPHAYASI